MKIEVNKYSLNPRWFVAGTKGSFGNEKLEFTFSKEWDGTSKKVTFIPFGGEEISLYYTEPIDIPYEVMVRAGTCVFAVSGYREEVKILSVTGEFKVLDTVASPDNSEHVPTPDEMTQVLNIATDAFDAAKEAKSIAQKACDDSNEVLSSVSATLEETKTARNEAVAARDQTVTALDVATEEYRKTFSNALIGKAEGRAVLLEDGVPYPQKVTLSVNGSSSQKSEPSLDSPSPIIYPVDITLNKLSRNFIPFPFESGDTKVNGVSFTKTGNGGVTMNGTVGSEISSPYVFYRNNEKPLVVLKKGVTYKLTCFGGKSIVVRLCGTGYGAILETGSVQNSKTITPENDTPIYKVLGYFISSSIGKELVDETIYPMLEILGENNGFEEHTLQSVAIPIELFGIGDCRDQIIAFPEERKVMHKIRYNCYYFGGNEKWTVVEQSGDSSLGYINVHHSINSKRTELSYQMCSRLPIKNVLDTQEAGIFVCDESSANGSTRIYARIPVGNATSSDFNAIMVAGEQLIYPSKEREFDISGVVFASPLLDIAQIEGAVTFDCEAEMSIGYIKDINKEIEKIYRAVIASSATV